MGNMSHFGLADVPWATSPAAARKTALVSVEFDGVQGTATRPEPDVAIVFEARWRQGAKALKPVASVAKYGMDHNCVVTTVVKYEGPNPDNFNAIVGSRALAIAGDVAAKWGFVVRGLSVRMIPAYLWLL